MRLKLCVIRFFIKNLICLVCLKCQKPYALKAWQFFLFNLVSRRNLKSLTLYSSNLSWAIEWLKRLYFVKFYRSVPISYRYEITSAAFLRQLSVYTLRAHLCKFFLSLNLFMTLRPRLRHILARYQSNSFSLLISCCVWLLSSSFATILLMIFLI